MELKKDLIGEYTGSCAPNAGGKSILVRNRTRIYEGDKGHLAYVITEHITDRAHRVTRRETYVGLVTGNTPAGREGVLHLHLSPLDKPYRGENGTGCDFLYSEDFNAYFIVFRWKESGEQIEFRLRKSSSNGSGRRKRN